MKAVFYTAKARGSGQNQQQVDRWTANPEDLHEPSKYGFNLQPEDTGENSMLADYQLPDQKPDENLNSL
jgi:hypothetical protein